VNVLVDSDILIEVSRSRDAELLDRWLELSESATTILYSPVTCAELWAGALPHEHRVIAALFRELTCATIDELTGRRAGEVLKQFGRSHNLKIADALIAASAVRHRAALWTRNRRHFPMTEVEFY
jgi:predicted nucleic acid-binding protein